MTRLISPLKILFPVLVFLVASASTEEAIEDLETSYSDYLTAVYAQQKGDVDRATEAFLRVLKKDPDNLNILEEAYTYFIYTGDSKNALDLARRLQKLEPGHNSSAMMLALDAFSRRKMDLTSQFLEKADGFGFDVLVGPLLKAWLLAEDGKGDEAIAEISQLKDDPAFEPFYAEHRAFILDKVGRKNEAEAAYLSILARPDVTSLQPIFAYGVFLQREGRKDEAKNLYDRFQPTVPTNLQMKEAKNRLEKGLKPIGLIDKPENAVAMALLRAAVELTREQAFYPGVVFARFAEYLNPKFDEALLFLGNMLSSENNPTLALNSYGEVDPKGPFAETALLRQALVLSFHDQREEGISLVKDYLSKHPESVNALVSLGDLYRAGEDYENALPPYDAAIKLKGTLGPEDWFLLFSRAIAFERLGQWESAEGDFMKALEFEPNNADILNYLGYSWIDQGMHLEKGREMIERAVQLAPNSGYILDSLGWAQFLMGEYQAAVETLEKALTLEPADPTVHEHLGDAYWRVGREREARFQWEHALRYDPDNKAKEGLAEKLRVGLNEPQGQNDPS